jgi:hypothetical protein
VNGYIRSSKIRARRVSHQALIEKTYGTAYPAFQRDVIVRLDRLDCMKPDEIADLNDRLGHVVLTRDILFDVESLFNNKFDIYWQAHT